MTSPEKIKEYAEEFIANKSTLRRTSKKYGISKSALHNYFRNKLKEIDESLYIEVKKLLKENRELAPKRGGLASKKKLKTKKQK